MDSFQFSDCIRKGITIMQFSGKKEMWECLERKKENNSNKLLQYNADVSIRRDLT